MLGDWGSTGAGAAFYAASMAAVGLAQRGLWFHPRRAGLTSSAMTPELYEAYVLFMMTAPAVFLASIPVAFLNSTVAELMWGGIALALTLLRRRIRAAGSAG